MPRICVCGILDGFYIDTISRRLQTLQNGRPLGPADRIRNGMHARSIYEKKLPPKMNSNEHQQHTFELAKAGVENAQQRIAFIDTKVSVAVGLLILLTPAPLAIAGWLSGLQGDVSSAVMTTVSKSPVLSVLTALALISGMVFASMALFCGVSCLSPRHPKGYKNYGPFQNEWRPNILFPIYQPKHMEQAYQHFHKLHDGLDFSFVISEYEHQLQQLGSILHGKFEAMQKCFWWLKVVVFCYGVALLFAIFICSNRIFSNSVPVATNSRLIPPNVVAITNQAGTQHIP
jgi:hypothetical protein